MWNGEIPAKPRFFVRRASPQPIVRPPGRCYARASLPPTEELSTRVEQPIELTAETLWNEVSGRLTGALNDSTYRTWFGEVARREL